MPTAPLLDVRGISKTHAPDRKVIDKVSFILNRGESLAVVGPSGAGKTTLLRILAGLEAPDSGAVFLDGTQLEDPEEQLVAGNPAIRMVHQDFKLSANRTVYENVDMLLRRYHADYRREESQRLLAAVRLGHLQEQGVHTLSGGEKQRLALARALADESRVVLLDEPFSQQDTILKARLYQILREEVGHMDKALVVVTHDPREAMAIGSRVAVLAEGAIRQAGHPEDLYLRPVSEQVARLMGPVNILPAGVWNSLLHGEGLEEGNDRVGIRPESLQLKVDNQSPHTILSVTFQGAYYDLVVAAGQEEILVRRPEPGYSIGQNVAIIKPKEERLCLVFGQE